ncbi:MAG: MBL fold metallo-hydrolase [Clostridium sp.]|nr:MBL fold metallo-hydrolase [Clostridium sp.]
MISIKNLSMNMLGENCYVISDDSLEAIVIDCGAYSSRDEQLLAGYIAGKALTVTHHLCTHAHFDHTFGCGYMARTYGVLPEFHTADKTLYDTMSEQTAMFMNMDYRQEMPAVGRLLNEGDEIHFGNHCLNVIHTPGHTPGGICLYCPDEDVLFSGDSLFQMSIGRTDFPGGNHPALINSLKEKIFILPEETKVYPGHGGCTTIGHERSCNPYLL